jgi:hypothetical protein
MRTSRLTILLVVIAELTAAATIAEESLNTGRSRSKVANARVYSYRPEGKEMKTKPLVKYRPAKI